MTPVNNNVPALRFSEFSSDWENTVLGNIAKFSKGKGISKADITEDGNIECIRYGELYTHYRETIKEIISKTNLDTKELVFSEANDIIIPASGESEIDIATASCVLKDGVALGGDLNIIKTNNDGVFLAYYLNNNKKHDIAALAQGVSVVHLYSSQLNKLEISLPSLPEQQKIASFLTAIDAKIELLTKKKALLEQYKKGVMQQLFSQKIRFKDEEGNDYPEWEEKQLKEIVTTVKRTTNEEINAILTISAGNGFLDQTERFSQVIAGSSLKKYTLLFEDEFSYNRGSSKNYKYGCIYRLKTYQKALVPNIYRSFRFNEGVPTFFEYLLSFNYLDEQLKGLISSSARLDGLLNISEKDFYSTTIVFPCYREQKKIADFLNAIDLKINVANEQLGATKVYKKGLLQQLFV